MERAITHVLYIATNCKICRSLRAQGIPACTRVENVIDIIPRPAWLDGTPILVDVGVGVLYKGSDALIVLDHMRQNERSQARAVQEKIPLQGHPQGPPPRPPQGYPQGPPQDSEQNSPHFSPHPRGPPQLHQPPRVGPDVPRREPVPASEAGDPHQVDAPTNWDAMFSEPVEDAPQNPGGRAQKFSESSIADMLTKRAQQTRKSVV